ncbi:MAG: hypothetical protein CME57_06115 [Halieaceae bacterium]|nr:hypothetical protein [Halieaceae bacterium]
MPLFEDDFFLACPGSHALTNRTPLKSADLRGESLLTTKEGHCLRDHVFLACSRISLGISSAAPQCLQNCASTLCPSLAHTGQFQRSLSGASCLWLIRSQSSLVIIAVGTAIML